MVIGTGIVFWPRASQLYICTSVPADEVFEDANERNVVARNFGNWDFSSHNPAPLSSLPRPASFSARAKVKRINMPEKEISGDVDPFDSAPLLAKGYGGASRTGLAWFRHSFEMMNPCP